MAARRGLMTNSDDRKARFFSLMARYNELGRLLPALDDLDTDDAVADAKLVIAEMSKVQAEMDALLERPT
jgi:hypothetical protein